MSNNLHDLLTTYPTAVLTKEEQEADEKMVSLQAESIVTTMAFPMVFKAALELGIIDTMAAVGNGAWLSPSEIAASLPTKPMNPIAPVLLDRMLRLLVSHSILKCRVIETKEKDRTGNTKRVYAAEPVCKSRFMLLHSEVFFKAWTNLKDVILEGKDAFRSAHGMRLFEFFGSDGQYAEVFNRAMSEASTMVLKKVIEDYKGFEDINTLVDVGGGTGTVLNLITSKFPYIKGINFDLAQVITHAPSYPGVEHVYGDMFKEVPKGDAILLKTTLHDWTDEHCIEILKNCYKSLPEKGKVIIIDMVTPTEPKRGDFSSNIVFAMDMLMLTNCSGGKERSLSEFENLAFQSGFTRCEVICPAYSYSVIEFHK